MNSKTAIVTAAILTGALTAPPAIAEQFEPKIYGGFSYAMFDVDVDLSDVGLPDYNANPQGAIVTFGMLVHELLGLEIRVAGGTVDDDDTVGGVRVTTDLNWAYGYYLRPGFNVTESIRPYLIAGWTEIDAETRSAAGNVDDRDDDFSYGIGVAVAVSPTIDITAEWMRYYDKGDTKIDAGSIGVEAQF